MASRVWLQPAPLPSLPLLDEDEYAEADEGGAEGTEAATSPDTTM